MGQATDSMGAGSRQPRVREAGSRQASSTGGQQGWYQSGRGRVPAESGGDRQGAQQASPASPAEAVAWKVEGSLKRAQSADEVLQVCALNLLLLLIRC